MFYPSCPECTGCQAAAPEPFKMFMVCLKTLVLTFFFVFLFAPVISVFVRSVKEEMFGLNYFLVFSFFILFLTLFLYW